MKLEKINYSSAVFFGVFSAVIYFLIGVFEVIARDKLASFGINVSIFQSLVVAPLTVGIVGYLIVFIAVLIYNCVAVKYPISWIVKK